MVHRVVGADPAPNVNRLKVALFVQSSALLPLLLTSFDTQSRFPFFICFRNTPLFKLLIAHCDGLIGFPFRLQLPSNLSLLARGHNHVVASLHHVNWNMVPRRESRWRNSGDCWGARAGVALRLHLQLMCPLLLNAIPIRLHCFFLSLSFVGKTHLRGEKRLGVPLCRLLHVRLKLLHCVCRSSRLGCLHLSDHCLMVSPRLMLPLHALRVRLHFCGKLSLYDMGFPSKNALCIGHTRLVNLLRTRAGLLTFTMNFRLLLSTALLIVQQSLLEC